MMTKDEFVGETVGPSAEFIDQVKDALEHLYDFSYLQRHPLADQLQPAANTGGGSAPQPLRRELMAAIETLNPGEDASFLSPQARLYNLLHLRYVEAMRIQEVANELNISVRQTHRDLRRGEESVAAILWTQRKMAPAEEPRAFQLSSIQEEMSRLETNPQPTDLAALLQRAKSAVEPLAWQRSINFKLRMLTESEVIAVDPVVAHQILVNLFTHAITQAQPGDLWLTFERGEGGVWLALHYLPKPETNDLSVASPVVLHLIERLGWKIEQIDESVSARVVKLQMTVDSPIILVVDDNEGLVELLARYLTGHAYRVTAAASGEEGLKLAQQLTPDAIILDIMMPEMDGWEFLQRLRIHSQTAAIPVIICSVFNEPELAYALGASIVLAKPVRKDEVLAALQELKIV
ncbi:MAG: response regulator [Chloroflexota bacterium]